MKRIKVCLLNLLLIAFLSSCFSAETTDNAAANQAIFSQANLDSIKSDSIQHILTKVVNDGNAPGIIAAIISNEGIIAVAFVIATPIAYYAMDKWLQNFAYRTQLSWWVFVLAGLLALAIALLTVIGQCWLAARRYPIDALRYE